MPSTVTTIRVSLFGGSFKVLVSGAAPAPGGVGNKNAPPVTDLDPDEVTLSGDPAARQAALKKLGSEMFPNVAARVTGMRQES